MPTFLRKLTFHRAAATAQPEAFALEPQHYTRFEGDRAVQSTELRWDRELLDLLGRLQRDAGDADARRKVGARLRDFLKGVAWDISEHELGHDAAGDDRPSLLTISAGAAELYALPWELAALPGSNRCLADLPHLLLRYEWPGLIEPGVAEGTAGRPPRILVAWSTAGGAVPAAEHLRWIRDAAHRARLDGIVIEEVAHVSGAALEEALARESGTAVLHILCHGVLRGPQAAQSAALRWDAGTNIQGNGEMDGDRLRRLLDPHRGRLRLVVLCACLGGDHDPLNLYVGSIAQAIHRLGIPAVVASRYPLSTRGSVRMTRVLYKALLVDGASLENALLRARAALHSERGKATEDDDGDREGCLSEDAYAIQLYARSIEQVRAEDGAPARRDVTAIWPFQSPRGMPGRPSRRRALGAKGPPFLVPFPRNHAFVGRDENLAELHHLLEQRRAVGVLPAALVGMGGIGKTQLAAEYAHRHRDDYPGGVYWVNAAQDWQDELARLAIDVGCNAGDAPESERRRRLVMAFGEHLRERPDSLLIFDNVDDPWRLQTAEVGFIPSELGCRLMFTTRRRTPDEPFETFEVRVLPEDAALRLLLSSEARRGVLELPPAAEELETARAICRLLGHLPLAIALAAAFLGKNRKVTLAGYRKRIQERGALPATDTNRVTREDLATRHDAAVSATLETQWADLESEQVRRVLWTIALFSEAAQVPRARIALLTGLPDAAEDGFAAPLEEALEELARASLVEQLTEHETRLHPLVREFAAAKIGDRDVFAAECAERLCETLWDMGRLHDEVAARGIDAVLQDLRVGSSLSGADGQERIERLLQPLDPETHRLRRWEPSKQPGFLLQQLRNRCFELQMADVQTLTEAKLDASRWPHLRERVRTSREPEALVRILEGHTDSVNCVAVTPDSRLAISGSGDGTLRVWELSTGRTIRTLDGHHDFVRCVAVTPDGRLAVSGSVDRTLRVWEISTGRAVRTLEGHGDWVRCVAVTPDGRLVVSASDDATLKIWEISTGRAVRTLEGHLRGVTSVAVIPGGRFAISSSWDRTMKIWELSSGDVVRTLSDHSDYVNGVAVTPDGRWAISASNDGTLKVWELSSGEAVRTLSDHADCVNGVAVTPDGRLAVSASNDGTLKVWELSSREPIRTMHDHAGRVRCVAVTPDGRFAISASRDNALKVWALSIERGIRVANDHDGEVTGIAVTHDNQIAVSASADRTLKLWRLSTGQVFCSLVGHTDRVEGVAVTPDGRLAISASADETLRVWDLSTGHELAVLRDNINTRAPHVRSRSRKDELKFYRELPVLVWTPGGVNGVAVTPDGRFAVSAHQRLTSMVKVWQRSSTWNVWALLEGHRGGVCDVAVTPDGEHAVSASEDGTLMVWLLSSSICIRTLTGHDGRVNAVAVTPDSRLAVSASRDATLKVWELSTGEVVRTYRGHSGEVHGVAVTADGRFAVSASADKTLRVWDLWALQTVAILETHAALRCCAATRDGTTILAGDSAGGVHILDWVHPPHAGR